MEVSITELREMQADRDKLVAEVATLRAKPESGTYNELADRVVSNSVSFTPDQKDQIRELILNRGHKAAKSA
ncbi:MAG TPA: hypothetical protein DDW52_19940 [Planctomycetaceae bacterium]|nr:hypothetical protein [Planctomycetaceae bacterium]